jgi:hypothetical protein
MGDVDVDSRRVISCIHSECSCANKILIAVIILVAIGVVSCWFMLVPR